MPVVYAIILGVVQGLTEFLPVSSSGHLVLVRELLGIGDPGLSFAIWVHAGTALATVVFLRQEIGWILRGMGLFKGRASTRSDGCRDPWRVIALVVLGSVPAGVAGLLMRDPVERAFSSPVLSSFGLIFTGLVLFLHGLGERKAGSEGSLARPFASVDWTRALVAGMAQAIAILPGVSRSGMTITAGFGAGMEREDAARFSFFLALVAVTGGLLLDAGSALREGVSVFTLSNLAGAGAAFLSGSIALGLVFKAVRRGRFSLFAYYCWVAGAIGLLVFLR